MEKWKRKTVELLSALALEEKKMPAVVPYFPQKNFISSAERPYFKRVSPRKALIRAGALWDMLAELEREPQANVHNIVVLKDGAVVCEASAPGYSVNTAHLSHSMSKTVTMLAIGLLFDERRIDLRWRVAELFPEITPRDRRFYSMTVEDLLTMKSGVAFAEVGSVAADRWTDAFFDGELKFAPGERFSYNSMNSYILSRIVTKITGQTLSEYLRPRLLSPLSIDNFYWEESSEAVSKGGFGVYMSAESWAKIGYLILGLGMWQGEQIISRSWLMRSLYPHAQTPEESGDFDYGYHIWVARGADEILLNGMFGQNVWICPKNNIVVAMNSGNNELFSRSPALDIVRRYLGADISGRSSASDLRELKRAERDFFKERSAVSLLTPDASFAAKIGLKPRAPFDPRWINALGTYAFPDNNAGILPLLVRVMQNNYSGGIKNFTLSKDKNKLFFTAFEGSEKYRIELGLYSFVDTTVIFGGERYIVSAAADISEDDDGSVLYRIEMRFSELPNVRFINLRIDGSNMTARLSETPNEKIAESYLNNMTLSGKSAFLFSLLEKKIGAGFIKKKLAALFNPTLIGINTDISGWEKTVSERSRELSAQREGENGFLLSLVKKFVIDADEERVEEPAVQSEGIFKRFLGKFIRRADKSVLADASDDASSAEKDGDGQLRVDEAEESEDGNSADGTNAENTDRDTIGAISLLDLIASVASAEAADARDDGDTRENSSAEVGSEVGNADDGKCPSDAECGEADTADANADE